LTSPVQSAASSPRTRPTSAAALRHDRCQ
jgi:hypothetical protein